MKKRVFISTILLFALTSISLAQKMTVKDSDAHVLMEVNDEGDVGSITLPSGAAPSTTTNKLYNVGGALYWDGSAVGTAGSAGGWTDGGTAVYLTTSTDKVGIGIAAPAYPLDVDSTIGMNNTQVLYLPNQTKFEGTLILGDGGGSLSHTTASEGRYNTAVGIDALNANTTGYSNTASGYFALSANTTGNNNTAFGYSANLYNQTGSNNTIIGYESGRGTEAHNKSGNVFIGYQAGYNETGSDKLYIANSSDTSPLIGGDFSAEELYFDGNVGIRNASPVAALDVDGRIHAAAHAANKGLKIPTNAGPPGAVTGTSEGDIVWDSSNNNLYVYDGSSFSQISGGGGGGLWESGTNGVYEDDAGVIVGIDQVETLANSGFSLAAGDLFVQDQLGVEGNVYTDGSFVAGSSLSIANGSITQSTGSELIVTLGGDAGDDFIVDTNTLVVESDNNRVGIGIVTPAYPLDVNGAIGINNTQVLYLPGGNFTGTLYLGDGGGSLSYSTDPDGQYNTAIGIGALNANESGYYNMASGYQALYSNTTGYHNTASGYQALRNNTTGSSNTATGHEALFSNTGSYNTANGSGALHANTTGIWNTAVGGGALYTNATGDSNTAVGALSLYSNTDGYSNTASGYGALYTNASGVNNTANGYKALYTNIGSDNTATGYKTLYSNAGGSYNTASGYLALYSNYNGHANTAIGYETLYSNTEGDYNTASGYQALYWNIDGDYNTAYGYNALAANWGGNNNTACGMGALKENINGSNSTAVGYAANAYNQSGSNNTIIGYEAGLGTAYHTKSGSVFIGYQAGKNENGSNKLYIANSSDTSPLIGGDFSADEVYLNGQVGIGTMSPSSETELHVQTSTNDNFGVLVEALGTAGTEIGLHTNTGKWASLVKNAYFSSSNWQRFDTGSGAFIQEIVPGGDVRFKIVASGTNPISWTEALTIATSGDIGIGNTIPSSELDVAGDIETGSSNAFYFGDPNTDGSWRIVRSGNNLVFERRESGSWNTKHTITP